MTSDWYSHFCCCILYLVLGGKKVLIHISFGHVWMESWSKWMHFFSLSWFPVSGVDIQCQRSQPEGLHGKRKPRGMSCSLRTMSIKELKMALIQIGIAKKQIAYPLWRQYEKYKDIPHLWNRQTNYYDACQLPIIESTYSGPREFRHCVPGRVRVQPPLAAMQGDTEVLKLWLVDLFWLGENIIWWGVYM